MKLARPSLIPFLLFILSASGFAQDLPIPGVSPGRDVPDAHLSPDPDTEYKVVFDFVMNDDNLDDPYPMLPLVARYVNTLANMGVPKENRKISIVMHRGSGLIGLNND